MSYLVTSQREFAGLQIILITAVVSQAQPDQPQRAVALGSLCRHGDQTTISNPQNSSITAAIGR